MKILETDRLILEEAVITDSPFFFELLNSPTWIEHIGDRGIHSLEDAKQYIRNSLIKSYQENGFGLYKMVLKKENKPIGICGLLKRDYLESPDIGFAILPEFEGKGYTTEAARATLNYGVNELQLSPILAITTNENKGSQKLLANIGLHPVGTIQPEEEKRELLLYSTEKLK